MAEKRKVTKPVPAKCNICEKPIEGEHPYFVDGRTTQGSWANMCPDCFKSWGTGLGKGFGQKYMHQGLGEDWVKVEG